MKEVVIVSAARTAVGAFNGSLSGFTAPQLGAIAIKEAVNRAGIKPGEIDEVLMGNVLQGGIGQAPARQASLGAGIPDTVSASTINKVCGSGLKSVMLGEQAIKAGDAEIIVAGGMESMTNAPYILKKARNGYRMGNGEIFDLMIHDGLWDPYGNKHMGMLGEQCAAEHKVSREMQDEFAKGSYEKAIDAIKQGYFKDAIAPVEMKDRKGNVTVFDTDEDPGKVNFEKAFSLKPVFTKEGTITAFNASNINDGAGAVVLMSKEQAAKSGAKPMARIVAQATHSHAPEWFTTAPGYVIEKVCKKAGLTKDDIDLFEINEAFAVVSCAVNQIAGIDPAKVNVTGGAIAIGHPIGASGARLLITLMYNLHRLNKRYGLVTLCNGGGEATAIIIEKI
ncbi:MAG TPA: acetyl-CoA C-acetyltransferase [Ignavibacteria bacterium]|nr:acetyl-CoA C-acetyltransferase [Ignavibacteria bacterium]HRF66384.1 acetyl-CoA C-acetyltransferase [Ignavibacteria bacterium]HRJ05488.1 acetyl-CoA C-acetyltransferase [Ignavibacteria bacterium]